MEVLDLLGFMRATHFFPCLWSDFPEFWINYLICDPDPGALQFTVLGVNSWSPEWQF